MGNIRILSAEETKRLMTIGDAIDAVSQVYQYKAKGDTEVFPLVFHEFNPGVADMDIKSGWVKGANVFGLKMVSWFGENPSKGLPALAGTVLVCDDQTGMPMGMLDGAHLTGMRTGASGAIGAKYLARPDATDLLLVGTGHISTFLLAATLMSCNVNHVRVYAPTNIAHAQAWVDTIHQKLQDNFGMTPSDSLTFEVVSDIEAATRASHIILTATPARTPILKADWVQPGTHISCVGADMPGKQEIDGQILAKARVFVDDLPQNCNIGEIEMPIKEGIITANDIIGELGAVINGDVVGRENDQQITVFDASGTALLDLMAAKFALEMANTQNVGTVVTL